ncbi:18309_t:CDS:2, partial [Dentiscutata erythropus]
MAGYISHSLNSLTNVFIDESPNSTKSPCSLGYLFTNCCSIGPKTVFFWAPLMKWALVIAGLSDLKRPPEKLSVSQSIALTATGVIWSRYSTQIIPINYALMSVNVFVAGTGITQLVRIW